MLVSKVTIFVAIFIFTGAALGPLLAGWISDDYVSPSSTCKYIHVHTCTYMYM